jgi:hypothetical protein
MTCLDCADPSVRVAKRNESVSSLQALTLLNNGFVLVQSEYCAERLQSEFADDMAASVERLTLYSWGRVPTAEEKEEMSTFAREFGLAALCRLVFNSNEFAFVD